MERKRSGHRTLLAVVFGCALIVGCSGNGSISLPYETGYALGTLIDALLIQPAMAPTVSIEIVESDSALGTVVLKANASSTDLPLSYLWEQLEGQQAQIASPDEQTTQIALPTDVGDSYVFRVTVTDAAGLEAVDEIQLNLHLGG